MSDLQIVLIVLGVVIIAGVVVYNWMQERKLHKNITEEFIVPQKDVLAEDFYIDANALVDKALSDIPQKSKITEMLNKPTLEPQMDSQTKAEQPPIKNALRAQTTEVVTDTQESSVLSQPEVRKKIVSAPIDDEPDNTPPLPDEVHAHIDLSAFLYATKNILAEKVKNLTDHITDDMGVSMMLHGLDDKGKWHMITTPSAEDAYKQFACSIQLADRAGPITKQVLNKFQFAVESMGLELGAHVEWQGSGDASQRANALDKFCIEVDQMVSVHLVQGDTPIHGTKLKGLAEANNMVLGKEGKFNFYAASNQDIPQFVLINGDHQLFTAESLRSSVIKGATFQIEIPKVSNCEQVFVQMIAVAQHMANSLGARIVDDNQKPLGDLQIEKIRQQLNVIHATMVARGVMPGSATSMRLFN